MTIDLVISVLIRRDIICVKVEGQGYRSQFAVRGWKIGWCDLEWGPSSFVDFHPLWRNDSSESYFESTAKLQLQWTLVWGQWPG